MMYDRTNAVIAAAEHCHWERNRGRTPAQVIKSVGRRPYCDKPDWNEARRVLAFVWIDDNREQLEAAE